MFDFSLSKKRTKKNKQKSAQSQSLPPLLKNSVKLLIILIVVLVGVFYIININALATKEYKIDSLKEKLEQIKITNQNLEIEVTKLQSINRIQQLAKERGLTEAKIVKYITAQDLDVAYNNAD